MTELYKYKTRLRPGEDVAAYENIIANCKTNIAQMVETAQKTEDEFLEFKLRTLKELEGVTSADVAMSKSKWMESPFDIYAK